MRKQKNPDTVAVLAYLKANPKAKALEVANELKVPLAKVYNVRTTYLTPLVKKPKKVPVSSLHVTMASAVDDILDDRAKDYGKFIEGAEIMQMLKRVVHNAIEQRGTPLAFDQREAIDMIIHKLGRIINGNPDKVDSWRDVAGYATLVADRLEGTAR